VDLPVIPATIPTTYSDDFDGTVLDSTRFTSTSESPLDAPE
jgi:hypothetical protein